MIKVYTNKENYQYDLHSLIKAFYPEQDVKVYDENALCSENEGNPSDGRVTVRFLTDRMETVIEIGAAKQYTSVYKNDTDVTKNQYKLSLYYHLCDYAGKTLPWGNLTGIRPTKLPMAMLDENLTDEEIIQSLKDTHAVSDEKAQLSLDIAKREKKILDSIHQSNPLLPISTLQ